jgi:exoribonuclease R
MNSIPKQTGILILKGNKSYGRTNNNRLLYKCIPDNKNDPPIYLPYEIQMGFSKVYSNKFVLYQSIGDGVDGGVDRNHNTYTNKGIITETIGDVDNLECYNRYQLYRKNLSHSIESFQKKIHSCKSEMTNEKVWSKFPDIENRTINESRIITIDSKNTIDIDDGLSCDILPNGNTRISVHITNPFVWFETFDIWSFISGRVSSIYFPEKRVPMFPPLFTEKFGSLKEGSLCFALTMDIEFDSTENRPLSRPTFHNTLIRIYKNYAYEDPEINDTRLFQFTRKIDPSINDSYDLVSYWMVEMNRQSAVFLRDIDRGIFRSGGVAKPPYPFLGKEIIPTLKTTLTIGFSRENPNPNPNPYLYITSPLRRIIDVYNITILSAHLFSRQGSRNDGYKISSTGSAFLSDIENRLATIENDFRNIRKIQFESKLLHLCFHHPAIVNKSYSGKILEVVEKGVSKYNSIVYIEELKLYSSVKTTFSPTLYNDYKFRIFTFHDENTTKRKIRVSIIDVVEN